MTIHRVSEFSSRVIVFKLLTVSPQNKSSLFLGLKFFFLGCCFQYLPEIIAANIDVAHYVASDGFHEGVFDLASLENGNYYLSLGRPRSPCSIYFDESLSITSRSKIPGLRNYLGVGIGFQVDKDFHPRLLKLSCEKSQTHYFPIVHAPVISSFYSGIFLQFLRIFNEMILGPISSIFFVILMIFIGSNLKKLSLDRKYHLFFGLCAFFHSVSLAHYLNLFIDQRFHLFIHIILRTFLSVSLVCVYSCYTKRKYGYLLVGHLLILIAIVFVKIFMINELKRSYFAIFPFFIISMIVVLKDFLRIEAITTFERMLLSSIVSGVLFQSLDYAILMDVFSLMHIAPVFILMNTMVFAYSKYQSDLKRDRSYQLLLQNSLVLAEREKISKQVVHDIRSPLLCLDILKANSPELSQDGLVLLDSSILRIQEIINDLTETDSGKLSDNVQIIDVETLNVGIRQVVIEKKFRCKFLEEVGIELSNDENRSGRIVGSLPTLKRVFSNIIDNSIESVLPNEKLLIQVKVQHIANFLQVVISDNGRGMPKSILNSIGIRGFSSGKMNGQGLGLSYSKQEVSRIGGSLEIVSAEKVGTRVIVNLPVV